MQILDNTPTWMLDDTTGTGHGLGRCNPYGYEGGVSVLGGTHKVEHEWGMYFCRNWATTRYWVVCTEGHRGQMAICDAHAYQFTHRQNGICPRCVWPDRARDIDHQMNDLMRRIAATAPFDRGPLMARLDDLRHEMDDLRDRGIIKTGGPLRLVEVS